MRLLYNKRYKFFFFNVHVPDRDGKRMKFLNNFILKLNAFTIEGTTVLVGDFNFIFDLVRDRTGGTLTSEHTRGSLALRPLLNNLGLTDTWLANKPQKSGFTYTTPDGTICSRLDRLYIERSLLKSRIQFDIIPVHFTDHCAIVLKIKSKTASKSAYWKLNASVLADPEYVKGFLAQLEVRKTLFTPRSMVGRWKAQNRPTYPNLLSKSKHKT